MTWYEIVYMSFLVLIGCFSVYLAIKNQNTFNKHSLIGAAILLYQLETIHTHDHSKEPFIKSWEVDYDDEEDYDKTLWRLWDWGYTRILPPDKYEFLKPYIERAVKMRKEGKK